MSREIDFLVAGKVLGIPCECKKAPGSVCLVHECVPYSKDLLLAGVVITKMRSDGFSIKIWQPNLNGPDYAKVSFICSSGPCLKHGNLAHNHHGAYDVEAETLPLAICEAALIALKIS